MSVLHAGEHVPFRVAETQAVVEARPISNVVARPWSEHWQQPRPGLACAVAVAKAAEVPGVRVPAWEIWATTGHPSAWAWLRATKCHRPPVDQHDDQLRR
jgi:hypothetical protein